MALRELQQLIANMDECQIDILSGIAVRMATVKAEQWTGKIAFELNCKHGVCDDVHVNRGETLRFLTKRRKIRSYGVK